MADGADDWFQAYAHGGGRPTPVLVGALDDPWTGWEDLTQTIDVAQLPDLAARLVDEDDRTRPAGQVHFAHVALLLREGPRRGINPVAILLARRRLQGAADRGHEKAGVLLDEINRGVRA